MLIEIVQAAETAAHVAAEAGVAQASGPIGTLGLNLKLFIAQLINFAVILLVLWKWAYKPLLKILHKRQQKIEESVENAQKIETRLGQTEQEYQKKMADARHDAMVIINRAEEDAQEHAMEIRKKNEEEVKKLIKTAKAHIATEKENAKQEIRTHAAQLVAAATAKLLEQEVDKEKSEAVIQKIIKT